MFLINVNDILCVWTINYDILFIPDIDNFSIFNIDKDTSVYMTYVQKLFIWYIQKYISLYYIWKFCLFIMETKCCLYGT